MQFESGLPYKKIKQLADSDAIRTLSKGGARDVNGEWQYTLNFQVPDPKHPGATKQARITKMSGIKSRGRGARTRKSVIDNYLPEWRAKVLEDVESVLGTTLNPESSVRKCVESYIDRATIRKASPIRSSTASNYRQIAKRIFRFPLADMPLISLNQRLVQSMLDDLAVGDDNHDGLSRKSIKDTHALLSQVCAAVLGADKNPCKLSVDDGITGVVLPDGKPTKRTREGKLNILTEYGIGKALQALDDLDSNGEFNGMSLAARISFNVALRSEEVAALTWSDVDLVNGTVSITHVIERTDEPLKDEDGMYIRDKNGNIKTKHVEFDTRTHYANADRLTKSESSVRTLKLSDDVVQLLTKRKDQVARELRKLPREERRSIGELYVLGGVDGSFFSVGDLGKKWTKFSKQNQLNGICERPISYHNIRHSVGSQLARRVPIMSLSKWLGHSSVATTEKYYLQTDEDALSEVSTASEALNNIRPVEGVLPINGFDRTGTDG